MTLPHGFTTNTTHALPLHVVNKSGFSTWRAQQPATVQAWLDAQQFDGSSGSHGRADQMGATTIALTAFKVTV